MSEMAPHEVPRADWPFFFDSFSRQHRGWVVTVDVLRQGAGAQTKARAVTFEGITADRGDGGEERISLMFGQAPEQHMTFVIPAPLHVRLDQTGIDRGMGEVLEIASADNTTTLVRFHAPVLPEQLDGIA